MLPQFERSFICYAPEDGSGGGNPATGTPVGETASGQAAAGAAFAGGSAPLAGASGSMPGEGGGWKAPDFLPEGLRGKDESETFNKLGEDWKRLREVIAKAPQPGKTIEDYQYQPSDAAKVIMGDLSSDPVYGLAREAAFRAGISPVQFGPLMSSFMDAMAEKGLVPKPYDPGAERAAFFGERGKVMSQEQMVAELAPQMKSTVDFLDGMKRTGQIDEGAYNAIGGLLDNADGFRAIMALSKAAQKASAGGPMPGGAPGGAQGMTRAQLQARMGDPRGDRDSAQYNPAFAAETLDLYKKFG